MKIQILSDIHLEFGLREFHFTDADLLILAGDIHIGRRGFDWISKKARDIPVIYVLGNHEYYKNAYPKLLHTIKKASQGTNIHVLENESLFINGITFHGSTLWTDFNISGNQALAEYECEQRMNDYRLIRRTPSYSRLRPIDTHMIHNQSLKILNESLSGSTTEINIVVTHHAPSIKSIAEEHQKDPLSAAFASNLEDFIIRTHPAMWIHGHVHKVFDYFIGQTRIICNPIGYADEPVIGAKENLIIEINQ
jgi:Icc-related predicted phosphoesterase